MVSETAQATIILRLISLLVVIVPIAALFVPVTLTKSVNIIVTVTLTETLIIVVSVIATPTLTVTIIVTVVGRVFCVKGFCLTTLLIILSFALGLAGVVPPLVLYLLSVNNKGSVFMGTKFLILVTPMRVITVISMIMLDSIIIGSCA